MNKNKEQRIITDVNIKKCLKNTMLSHTVVYSSDDFIFKPDSIDKVAGHRFGTGDLKGTLQLGFYLRKPKIRRKT